MDIWPKKVCRWQAHEEMLNIIRHYCYCLADQLCPTCDLMEPARLLYPWDLWGKNTGVGCHLKISSLGGLPNPGIEPTSPALAGGFFTPQPPRKPKFGCRIFHLPPLKCLSFIAPLNLQSFVKIWFSPLSSRPIPHSWVPMILIVPNYWPNKTHDRHPHLLPLICF